MKVKDMNPEQLTAYKRSIAGIRGGCMTSEEKAAAAKVNGKLGGRPKRWYLVIGVHNGPHFQFYGPFKTTEAAEQKLISVLTYAAKQTKIPIPDDVPRVIVSAREAWALGCTAKYK